MNIVQMGLKYGSDSMGRPKLVKMDQKEQEALMQKRFWNKPHRVGKTSSHKG